MNSDIDPPTLPPLPKASEGQRRLRRAKKKISKLPDAPGVYKFVKGTKVLYVGKATSLRDRVRSYFSGNILESRSPLIAKMLSEFTKIDYIKTDSVLEALILEANLIKKYQPEANIKEKDDRSFNYVVIIDEDFPRVLIMRGKELSNSSAEGGLLQTKSVFGPFPNSSQLKEAMKIVRKMFPFRDKCQPHVGHRVAEDRLLQNKLHRNFLCIKKCKPCKPCFNRQINLCPGVCTGEINEKEYAKIIKNIVLFFEGNKKKIKKNLEKQMKDLAKARKFEEANKIKKIIFSLNHIQDVALIKNSQLSKFSVPKKSTNNVFRVESYDVAHISGTNVVGVMTVVENGEVKKSDYRKFKIIQEKNNDIKALVEVVSRRLKHIEWPIPNIIVVDGGKTQKSAIEKVLKKNHLKIPVMSVVKNDYHKPKEILGDRSIFNIIGKKWSDLEEEILLANSEAHRFAINYHRKIRDKLF